MSLDVILAEVAQRLQYVAPTHQGQRELAKLAKPPRYVWVPRSESFGAPGAIGGNPRSLHDRLIRCDVHCWAIDIAGASWLEQALVTAVRETVKGANYTLAGAEWLQPEWLQLGIVCTVSLDLRVPLPVARIPDAPGDPPQDSIDVTVPIERIDTHCG